VDVVISGCKPWDGRYELDLNREFTTREWGWIKRHAGYLPLAVSEDAFGDPELVCVLAVIAIRRADRIGPSEVAAVYERLADAPFGSAITIDSPEPDEEAEPDPPASSSVNAGTSGTASPASSETPATRPKPTGIPGSGTSVSAPPTLAS
jgi:hypothetical protein